MTNDGKTEKQTRNRKPTGTGSVSFSEAARAPKSSEAVGHSTGHGSYRLIV